jgi:TolB-like protein
VKIDNGTGGSRETSTDKPARVDERGRESINFFAELKRRNVYKVAAAYAVVGWLVIQVSSTVLPTFHAPEWVVQTLMALVALGFPIALLIAWAFELTPQGLKRTEDADLVAPARTKSHTWIYVVIVGVLFSVGLFFVGRYTALDRVTTSGLSEKSIAVLPFENQNHDPDADYLCDGIPESIINSLSELPKLKVMSRNSVFHYKGKEVDAQMAGKELKVQTLLTGRVRQRGDGLTIGVELINAEDNSQLWGQQYSRKLADVFAVQEEIAREVSEKLRLKLTALDPLSSVIARAVVITYYFKRDYQRAFELLREANELGPPLSATWEIGLFIRSGSLNEAFAEIEKAKDARKRDPLLIYSAGMAYAASGKQAEPLQSIKELEAMSGASLSTAHWIAKIYATLNDKESAFSWLERGLATGALGVFYKDEPVWDPIRDDPRFATFVEKMVVPESEQMR